MNGQKRIAIQEHLVNNQPIGSNYPMTNVLPNQQQQHQQHIQMHNRNFRTNQIRHPTQGQMMQPQHQQPHPHHPQHHQQQHHQQQPQQSQQQQTVQQISGQIRSIIPNQTTIQHNSSQYANAMNYMPSQFQQYQPVYYSPYQHHIQRLPPQVSYQTTLFYPQIRAPQIPTNIHPNQNSYVASNQDVSPQITENLVQNFGPPKQTVSQQPKTRTKHMALIQDPKTGELIDLHTDKSTQPVVVPAVEPKLQEPTKTLPQTSIENATCTNAALEFQNMVSKAALSKKAEATDDGEKVSDKEINDKIIDEKTIMGDEVKEEIKINENDESKLSLNLANNLNISESDVKVDTSKDIKTIDDSKDDKKQSDSVIEKNLVNEKNEISRTPSPVTSTPSSSTLSTPSMSVNINNNDKGNIDIINKNDNVNKPVLNQPNGDINEVSLDDKDIVKECKDLKDEYKIKEDKDIISSESDYNIIKNAEKLINKEETIIINETIDASSVVNKDEIDFVKNIDEEKKIVVDSNEVKKIQEINNIINDQVKDEIVNIVKNDVDNNRVVNNENVINSVQSTTAGVKQQQSNQAALKAEVNILNLKKNGKFEYESNFLRKLQNAPASLVKPKTLPNLEIIHDSPICSRPSVENRQPSSTDMFFPNFVTVPNQNRNQPRNISMRSSQGGRSNSQHDRPRKIISPSITQDVKLHTTENAWKPKAEENSKNLNNDELATEKLAKAFRGILNKLTPEKYEKLLLQVEKLQINTVQRLELILKLIFEKAVDEPAFCLQYAHLCKHLCLTLKVDIKDENDQSKTVQFLHLLVTKCQQEFEGRMYEGIDVEGRRQEISQISDDDKKKILLDELDDEMRRARKRSLGNIKLIGELYKLGTIKCFVMIICVKKLLTDGEEAEESLECLCTLLRTIGQKLEEDFAAAAEQRKVHQTALTQYYVALENFTKNDKISSRVRFMIQDIIDLRNDGWKERKVQKENKPKTITEIHKEAQEEEIKMLRLQQQQQQQQQQSNMPPHSFQKRQDSLKKEFNLGRKSQSGTNTIQAFKSIGMNKPNSSEPTLGPSSMGSWGKGAGGGGSISSSQQKQNTNVVNNRYSVLSDNSKQQGRGGSQSKEIKPSNVHEGFVMKKSDGPSSVPPFGLQNKQIAGRASSSRENTSVPNSRNASISKESPKEVKPLTDEEIERISINLVKEYISNKNSKEVGEDVKASLANVQLILFVKTAIDHALEVTSQKEQNDTGMLFKHLLDEKILTLDYLRKGFEQFIEIADDIVVDVPKFWDYTANIFAPVFLNLNDDDRKNFFVDTFTLAKGANKAGKCVNLIIHRAIELLSEKDKEKAKDKLKELWFNADLKLSDFLNEDEDEKEFIEKNKLQLIESSNKNSLVNSKLFLEIEEQVEKNISEENLIDYIQEKFTKDVQQTADFVSALFKSVVKGCLNKVEDNRTTTYSLNKKKLVSRCKLLGKFCNNEESNEIGAIFALQKLAEELEHPSKMLNGVFQTLHDQNVISQNAFFEWEKSGLMVHGKAMAVLNAKQFLTWLREEDSE